MRSQAELRAYLAVHRVLRAEDGSVKQVWLPAE